MLRRAEAPQGDPELGGSEERGPVRHRVQQQVGVARLHVVLPSRTVVGLQRQTGLNAGVTGCAACAVVIYTQVHGDAFHLTSASDVSSRVIVAASPSTSIFFSHTSSEIIDKRKENIWMMIDFFHLGESKLCNYKKGNKHIYDAQERSP